MNTQLSALWILFAAAAAVVIFAVVHKAMEVFAQAGSVLAGT